MANPWDIPGTIIDQTSSAAGNQPPRQPMPWDVPRVQANNRRMTNKEWSQQSTMSRVGTVLGNMAQGVPIAGNFIPDFTNIQRRHNEAWPGTTMGQRVIGGAMATAVPSAAVLRMTGPGFMPAMFGQSALGAGLAIADAHTSDNPPQTLGGNIATAGMGAASGALATPIARAISPGGPHLIPSRPQPLGVSGINPRGPGGQFQPIPTQSPSPTFLPPGAIEPVRGGTAQTQQIAGQALQRAREAARAPAVSDTAANIASAGAGLGIGHLMTGDPMVAFALAGMGYNVPNMARRLGASSLARRYAGNRAMYSNEMPQAILNALIMQGGVSNRNNTSVQDNIPRLQ